VLHYYNLDSLARDNICGADSIVVPPLFRNCRHESVSKNGNHYALLRHRDGLVYDAYLTQPVSRGEWEALFLVEPRSTPRDLITIAVADVTSIGRIEEIPIR